MRSGSRLHAVGVFLAIGSIALLGSARAYEVFHGPTELIYSDPEKAAPGYLLLPSWPRIERYEYIYLINLEGEVVHMWKTVPPEYEGQGYILEKTARMTEKGSIVVGLSTDAHSYQGQRVLQELDWDGNLAWAFSDPREGYLYHHNFKRIWNNHLNDWTIIFTSQFPMTQEQAVAAGADPSVEWDAAPEGEVVWEYIVPVMAGLEEGATPSEVFKKTMSDKDDNAVFTAHWIAPDHPGLAGRDLTPKGKITDIMLLDRDSTRRQN